MPFDRSIYPDGWEQIVAVVEARAGNACEWCGAPNGQEGRHVAPLDWRPVSFWADLTVSLYGTEAGTEDRLYD